MRDLLLGCALAAALLTPATAQEAGGCPETIDDQFLPGLGEPSATLAPGQTVYTPPGLTMLDRPVSYVVITGPDAADTAAPVRQVSYRLTGLSVPFGSDYPDDLARAFDKAAGGAGCADDGACVVDYRDAISKGRAGIELSLRSPSVPSGASGDAVPLVRADYDLEGADPVFLVCHYAP